MNPYVLRAMATTTLPAKASPPPGTETEKAPVNAFASAWSSRNDFSEHEKARPSKQLSMVSSATGFRVDTTRIAGVSARAPCAAAERSRAKVEGLAEPLGTMMKRELDLLVVCVCVCVCVRVSLLFPSSLKKYKSSRVSSLVETCSGTLVGTSFCVLPGKSVLLLSLSYANKPFGSRRRFHSGMYPFPRAGSQRIDERGWGTEVGQQRRTYNKDLRGRTLYCTRVYEWCTIRAHLVI